MFTTLQWERLAQQEPTLSDKRLPLPVLSLLPARGGSCAHAASSPCSSPPPGAYEKKEKCGVFGIWVIAALIAHIIVVFLYW